MLGMVVDNTSMLYSVEGEESTREGWGVDW